MNKFFLLSCLIASAGVLNAQESSSGLYGISASCEADSNSSTGYSLNIFLHDMADGTDSTLNSGEKECNGVSSASSVDTVKGIFYIEQGDGSIWAYDYLNNTFELLPQKDLTGKGTRYIIPYTDKSVSSIIDEGVDASGDAITLIGTNEVVGSSGNTLISEEENGEIHIGENSLVTIEQDGKQQLYATDANGDQIDINIKKGSDLLVDGKSVSQAITDVATNKTNIATNTTNIATNKTNIATNKTNIATNTTNITTNTQAIASLGTRVDGLTNLVNTFDQRITDLQTLTGTMMSEYRSGIASSVALSQIRYASKGFSIGVGQGEFKDKDEMAVGIGYGGEFNDRVGYQFQFGSSGDTSGFGFTITF